MKGTANDLVMEVIGSEAGEIPWPSKNPSLLGGIELIHLAAEA